MAEDGKNWVEEIIEDHEKERQERLEEIGASGLPASSPVTKEDFQDAAVHFNDFVDQEWPQEKDGELNYYPLGSLTFALYSQADAAYRLDNDRLPEVERTEELQLPASTQAIFAEMTRPIGDFDFLQLNSGESPGKGGVISYEEINPIQKHPEKPHPQLILKRGDEGKPFFDPLQTGDPDPIQLEIDGEIHYAPSFKDTAVYKALHLLERYEADPESDRDFRKNQDMDREFPMVLEAVEPFYSREEMVEDIHDSVLQSEINSLNWRVEDRQESKKKLEEAYLDRTLNAGEIDDRELSWRETQHDYYHEDNFYSDNLKWFAQLLIRSDASEEVKDFFWDVWEEGPYQFVEEAQERGIEYSLDIPGPEDYNDSEAFLEDIDEAYKEYHDH